MEEKHRRKADKQPNASQNSLQRNNMTEISATVNVGRMSVSPRAAERADTPTNELSDAKVGFISISL